MNENLKKSIVQKLENLTDETGRQLLDYMEFLESKFNRSTRERSTFERLAENVEGTLRSSKLGDAAVRGTGDLIDVASSVARKVAAAGQAVFDELEKAVGGDTGKEDEKAEDVAEETPLEHPSEAAQEESATEPETEESATEDAEGGEKPSA